MVSSGSKASSKSPSWIGSSSYESSGSIDTASTLRLYRAPPSVMRRLRRHRRVKPRRVEWPLGPAKHSGSASPSKGRPSKTQAASSRSSTLKKTRKGGAGAARARKSLWEKSSPSSGGRRSQTSRSLQDSPARSPPPTAPRRETLTNFSPPPPFEETSSESSTLKKSKRTPLKHSSPRSCRTPREPAISDIPSPHTSELDVREYQVRETSRSPPRGAPPRETLTDFSPPAPSEGLFSSSSRRRHFRESSLFGITPRPNRRHRLEMPVLEVDMPSPNISEVGRVVLVAERQGLRATPGRLREMAEQMAAAQRAREDEERWSTSEDTKWSSELGAGAPQEQQEVVSPAQEEPGFVAQEAPPSPSRSSGSKRKRESDGEEGAESIQQAPPSVPHSSGSKRSRQSDAEEDTERVQQAPPSMPHSSGSKRSRQSDGEEDTERVQQAPPSMPHSSGSKRAREQEETPSKSSKRPREAQEEVEPPSSVSRYNLRDTPARRRFRAAQTERKQVRAKDLSKRSK